MYYVPVVHVALVPIALLLCIFALYSCNYLLPYAMLVSTTWCEHPTDVASQTQNYIPSCCLSVP